jgi:hypothetical protein
VNGKLIHPRGKYEVGPRKIQRVLALWLFLHIGIFHTARAKNSENEQEYDDLRYGIDEKRGRQINKA